MLNYTGDFPTTVSLFYFYYASTIYNLIHNVKIGEMVLVFIKLSMDAVHDIIGIGITVIISNES
jgi:hypothetical protein